MNGTPHVVGFYDRHPISAAQILGKLRALRGHLDGLRPEELFPHDQDHYGGLAANDALAVPAGIGRGTRVADFCAGLAGPARYFAHHFGAAVTGIELNPHRVRGAQELTLRVGLQNRVGMIRGNVAHAPLANACVDVVVSQEAFLHVPDKAAAIGEAFRILVPGGRLAFSDWVAHHPLAADQAATLWQGLAAQTLQSTEGYRGLLQQAGFQVRSVEDLTEPWGAVLGERLAMYRKLRRETSSAGLPSGDAAFYRAYVQLVALVRGRVLGGGRFIAEK